MITKEVFLNKLKGAFETFKNEKDQKLNYYPGVCNSNECTNTGCKGYTFVGDTSGASLDLIFDEKNGEVNDIYYCNSIFKLGFQKNINLVAPPLFLNIYQVCYFLLNFRC